ncbi:MULTISPECIES: DUF202 domain-containing protein [unclassified Solwaraspora]|uniref:DUF202 domain-containing protein n=1 Tax=unclassified Solwaraspora TaxID=2627926 RepID=UPI00248B58F8|nr:MULTISPECIES: DUF202 domain-containing protein [unclassified Solwaraspora]WBB98379.1 DUF202 domain-containing protein [Solwaraspora sp. WMMA2059]WBC23068.1 DUF202 domain-containing protein [Solwaraspora sp. WMMA2080]WJK34898.1 DUF202 domain-containing protein [Solwaraspora sp. WMMA2065]
MADPTDPPAREHGPPARDPGLQPERTRLAWRRSALALTLVVALTMRLAVERGGAATLLGLFAVIGWAGLIGHAYRHASGPRRPAAGQISTEVPLLGLVTAGYAALGAILILS